MIYLLILLGIVLLVAFMPIRMIITTVQRNNNQLIVIKVKSFYGLLNLKFEIPYMDLIIKGIRPALQFNAKLETGTGKKLIDKNKILTLFEGNKIIKFYKASPISFNKLMKYTLRKTKIKDFFLNFTLGTEDAYYTALLYGVLWSIIGSIVSLRTNKINMTIQDISIIPAFDKKTFQYELSCIITIKAGHIIIVGIKALPVLLNARKKIVLQG